MYNTKFGPYDGNSWEDLMQLCFRLKYENEHYQSIPASSGDCGIEGFTKTGKVFQCYCPDNNLSSSDLYDKQRDKITRDLKKLETYETRLRSLLGQTRVSEWILVTPEYRMNDLIIHCNSKQQEILTKNLSIIDPTFKVLVHDIDNFQKEIPIALNGTGQKLQLSVVPQDGANVTHWKDQQIDLVSNAIRKHTKRFPENTNQVEEKVNTLTESTIQYFLDREVVLRQWQRIYPEDYDKFLILLSSIEKEVKEKCMFPTSNNNELYLSLRPFVKEKLKENFKYLDDLTLDILMHGAIADWLLRCPLDFE
jgi:flagellar basal body rod protein FlgB